MADERQILNYSNRRPPPKTSLSTQIVMAVFVLLVFCLIVLLGVS